MTRHKKFIHWAKNSISTLSKHTQIYVNFNIFSDTKFKIVRSAWIWGLMHKVHCGLEFLIIRSSDLIISSDQVCQIWGPIHFSLERTYRDQPLWRKPISVPVLATVTLVGFQAEDNYFVRITQEIPSPSGMATTSVATASSSLGLSVGHVPLPCLPPPMLRVVQKQHSAGRIMEISRLLHNTRSKRKWQE